MSKYTLKFYRAQLECLKAFIDAESFELSPFVPSVSNPCKLYFELHPDRERNSLTFSDMQVKVKCSQFADYQILKRYKDQNPVALLNYGLSAYQLEGFTAVTDFMAADVSFRDAVYRLQALFKEKAKVEVEVKVEAEAKPELDTSRLHLTQK